MEARHHAVGVRVDAGHVDAVERRAHPELRGLTRAVRDLRGVQQGLGRDAAHVQAGAAELALLHQPHLESELRGAQGARVAAGPGPEDEYVEVGHSPILALRSARVHRLLHPLLIDVRRAHLSPCHGWTASDGAPGPS